MELILLGGLGLMGVSYLTSDFSQNGLKLDKERSVSKSGRAMKTNVTEYKDPQPKYKRIMFDMSETGFIYGIERPMNMNLTNLNEAFKPYSAPRQTPTYSVPDVLQDKAKTLSYLEATASPFYFNKKQGYIPLGNNQNANPMVEIPGKASIKGDRHQSLAHYPRVYFTSGEELKKKTSEPYDKMLDAGMPTESEKKYVPLTGKLNREWNPWGPGGHLQILFNRSKENKTRSKMTNQAHMMAPVYDYRLRNK